VKRPARNSEALRWIIRIAMLRPVIADSAR